MKKQFVLLLLATVWLTAFRNTDALEIGAKMPKGDVKMKDVSGKDISLNDAKKANGLLVMFSCNTCPYVARNVDRTREISEYALKQQIGVVLLNSNEAERAGGDSYEAMKAFAKKHSYHWFYAVDKNNELADAFAADRTPECYLFNKEGTLVYKGAIDDNPGNAGGVQAKYLHNAINAMVAGKAVEVTTSASVGCGIKRKM